MNDLLIAYKTNFWLEWTRLWATGRVIFSCLTGLSIASHWSTIDQQRSPDCRANRPTARDAAIFISLLIFWPPERRDHAQWIIFLLELKGVSILFITCPSRIDIDNHPININPICYRHVNLRVNNPLRNAVCCRTEKGSWKPSTEDEVDRRGDNWGTLWA